MQRRATFSYVLGVLLVFLPSVLLSAQELVLTHATIIDGTGSASQADMNVVIRDGKIAEITSSAIDASVQTLDLEGRFLLPGFIDAHSHLQTPDGAKRALESGVTTIRVVGDRYLQSLGVRDLIRDGHLEGPEMLTAGPLIRPKPGIAFYVAFPQFGEFLSGEFRGPDNIRAAVRAVLDAGADLIKVGASERAGLASTDPRRQELDYEEMKAAVEEAAKDGKFVCAHAHAESGIEDAVRAGVRSIEHGTYMNQKTLELMKEKGTFLVPTLAIMSPLGDPQSDAAGDVALRIRTWHMQTALREIVKKAYKMGIPMAASTDGSYGDGDDTARVRIQHDMEDFVECGFTTMEAITAATRNAAQVLGIDSRVGTIAKGLEADLVVLDRSPLDDLRALYEPLVVITDGRVAVNRIY
jgi:imidazolonepropionase-like amidohydrolase